MNASDSHKRYRTFTSAAPTRLPDRVLGSRRVGFVNILCSAGDLN
jgi:hypothetical protein